MKGLSPLIAVVILIAVTVFIGAILMTWMTSLSQSQTATVTNRSSEIVDCTARDIQIVDVFFDEGNSLARIGVRNGGTVSDSVTAAELFTKSGENLTATTPLPVSISRGDITFIEFTLGDPVPNCGNFSKAYIASNCESEEFDKPPKNC